MVVLVMDFDQRTTGPVQGRCRASASAGGEAGLEHYADRLTRELMRIRRLLRPGVGKGEHESGRGDDRLPRMERGGYMVLAMLVTEGPHRVKELAERTRADPSGVSRAVSALVERGLAERHADPDDGRATQLVATEHGREMFARARARRRALLSKATAAWSEDDVVGLVELLERLTADLETASQPDEQT